MEEKVLMVYHSKHGATKGIAEKISEIIKQSGKELDFMLAEEVEDINKYSAVIIGSSIYIGNWGKSINKFIVKFQDNLSNVKTWIFSSGPTGKGDPVELIKGWTYPKKLKPVIDSIKPADIRIFHGELDENKLSGMEKFAIKRVKSPMGDFRDWDDIEQWANKIVADL